MLTAQAIHKRACRVLPQVFSTCGIALNDDSEAGLAALLFPLRRPSNGAVAFRLSETNARQLRTDPQGFLQDALVAREGLGRFGLPARYRQWRRVMLPCGDVWFTTRVDGCGVIVVVPDEARVVYLWRDGKAPLPSGVGLG
jgi:hypothetical protein